MKRHALQIAKRSHTWATTAAIPVSKAEGICMLSETGFSYSWGVEVGWGQSHFLSILKTLPQITWPKIWNFLLPSQGISQSPGTAFPWCPASSVTVCRWDKCEFLNIFQIFWGQVGVWYTKCTPLGLNNSTLRINSVFFMLMHSEWLGEDDFDCSNVCVD